MKAALGVRFFAGASVAAGAAAEAFFAVAIFTFLVWMNFSSPSPRCAEAVLLECDANGKNSAFQADKRVFSWDLLRHSTLWGKPVSILCNLVITCDDAGGSRAAAKPLRCHSISVAWKGSEKCSQSFKPVIYVMCTKSTAVVLFGVLPPVFRHFAGLHHFFGRVSTVQCFEDNSRIKEAVESPGQGRVLVVDGGGSLRRTLVGCDLAAAAQRNGWAGLLVFGCVRDVAELQAQTQALGIVALAAMPMPTEKRGQGQRDVPVEIAGVLVRPGGWVYADADGVIVSTVSLL